MKNYEDHGDIDDDIEYEAYMQRRMQQRKRWRDVKGVVHVLVPHRMTGMSSGIAWAPACGKTYNSDRECDENTPATCLACVGGSGV